MELTNFVTGANKNEAHFVNVNHERDFDVKELAVIRSADEGDICPVCNKGRLGVKKGIEVGNTFNLGYKYSNALGAKYVDQDGQEKPFYMGSYGIGVTRTIQAAVERYNDDNGIIWPAPLAPYAVEVVPLSMQDENLRRTAMEFYDKLSAAGLEVLIDDRDERAGVKLNDADLVGIPLRINIGAKSLKQGNFEFKERTAEKAEPVAVENAVETARKQLDGLMKRAQST
jgi:prolyl-tRNA synthetase